MFVDACVADRNVVCLYIYVCVCMCVHVYILSRVLRACCLVCCVQSPLTCVSFAFACAVNDPLTPPPVTGKEEEAAKKNKKKSNKDKKKGGGPMDNFGGGDSDDDEPKAWELADMETLPSEGEYSCVVCVWRMLFSLAFFLFLLWCLDQNYYYYYYLKGRSLPRA